MSTIVRTGAGCHGTVGPVRSPLPALVAALLLLLVPAAASAQDPAAAFDGDAMWVWQVSESDGGDPAAMVARARAAGLEYVVVKAAQGTRWWPQFDRELVAALKAGGLRVCAYQRAVARRPAREARVLARAVGEGADCLVVDAEIEYEGRYAQARRYVDALRDAVGDAFPVALTSFPYVHVHRAFPYSVFLGPRGAQVTMPQIYWKLLGTDPQRAFAATWPLNAIYGRPVRPIGQSFHRPSRAAMLRFRRLAERHGATGVSWWVWQHARPADWAAIGAPLTPPSVDLPTAEVGKSTLARRRLPRTAAPATLRPGQSGDPVRWLQLRLRAHGATAPLTGRFDARTTAAVLAFRSSRLLAPMPQIDPATWAALLAAPEGGTLEPVSAPSAASPPPSTSPSPGRRGPAPAGPTPRR
jgi:hypothetical protein